MPGTAKGGAKSAATNKRLYGDSFYERIGKLGGSAKVPKGFAVMPFNKVSAAGRRGGANSRRRKSLYAVDNTPFSEGFSTKKSWWRRIWKT